MKLRSLLFALTVVFAASLVWSQSCVTCEKGNCVSAYSGGCQCPSQNPCMRCGVCVPVLGCIFPCEGTGGPIDLVSVQAMAGFTSVAEIRAGWASAMDNDQLLNGLRDQGFDVLARLIEAERYVRAKTEVGCGSLSRGGSFNLTRDFREKGQDGDEYADWEAVIDSERVEYHIKRQPDSTQPDRLVIGKSGWVAYRGEEIAAKGEL